jgi:DNA mismatch repair ATPase MutS
MAQCGFKVAARDMRLTPVDRIFTRVGAQDSLVL